MRCRHKAQSQEWEGVRFREWYIQVPWPTQPVSHYLQLQCKTLEYLNDLHSSSLFGFVLSLPSSRLRKQQTSCCRAYIGTRELRWGNACAWIVCIHWKKTLVSCPFKVLLICCVVATNILRRYAQFSKSFPFSVTTRTVDPTLTLKLNFDNPAWFLTFQNRLHSGVFGFLD